MEESAWQYSQFMAEEFIATHSDWLKTSECEFTIEKTSEIAKSDIYCMYKRILSNILRHNEEFNTSIFSFGDIYMNKNGFSEGYSSQQLQFYRSLSHRYLVEELCIAACLADRGYKVSVYPGSIELFHDISSGKYPELPSSLKQLINVGIQFKRKSA